MELGREIKYLLLGTCKLLSYLAEVSLISLSGLDKKIKRERGGGGEGERESSIGRITRIKWGDSRDFS